jgi:quinol monooxygenase YgiN
MKCPRIGFAVLYRWRIRPELADSFVAAWALITQQLRAQRGGLGSRLHRGPDGVWYAYAQWPSAAAREAAFAGAPIDPAASAEMRAAIIEALPEIPLEPVADFLILPVDEPHG